MFFVVTLALLGALIIVPAANLSAQTPRTKVLFETTLGNFTVETYDDLAPETTKNFLSLIEKKYYDGTIFHRVIDGFMIQGGDPLGTGRGGPGYSIKDEFGPGLTHNAPGILSMANAGPNTGGSQFFITLVPTEYLDNRHAIFGQVVDGLSVVQAIGKVQTDGGDRPLTEVKINKLSVVQK
ncbi:MAG: peptidylprolyl isomerase [Deltaproteobacteria bacterium]|jgi:cyclophilin family peptidyl-prolyl cis-trans isomerase|nr:peptidylprolyl isomerase [Deltaproteobacteria bacterium]